MKYLIRSSLVLVVLLIFITSCDSNVIFKTEYSITSTTTFATNLSLAPTQMPINTIVTTPTLPPFMEWAIPIHQSFLVNYSTTKWINAGGYLINVSPTINRKEFDICTFYGEDNLIEQDPKLIASLQEEDVLLGDILFSCWEWSGPRCAVKKWSLDTSKDVSSILFTTRTSLNYPDPKQCFDDGKEILATLHLKSQPTSTVNSRTSTKTITSAVNTTPTNYLDTMKMVIVPAGEFIMGSPENEHPVWLNYFYIDETEVTNKMYMTCIKSGGCKPKRFIMGTPKRPNYIIDYPDYPVVWVDWVDAQAYCNWVGKRLPTEAEWEKAARGTDGRKYPWGNDDPDCSMANFWNNSAYCIGDTVKVGSYKNNISPYGALDMAGNVWEWVSDWWGPNRYSKADYINPKGPSTGKIKLYRGGTYGSDISGLLTYDVYPEEWGKWPEETLENQANETVGFRCVRN
jgi:formylglycine-generating enzyme required for sulfatase activity